MERTKELGSKPIGKLLLQYSIPAVIAMMVNAIYNIVDRIFIGKYAGEASLAGLTLAFPIMMFIFSLVALIGVGGAAIMSIRFGEKDVKGAGNALGNALSIGLIVNIIVVVLIYLNLQQIFTLFDTTPEVVEQCSNYMKIILYGTIFQVISFILSNSVRTEGQPILSMVAMISAAVTNIVLDFIFIVLLKWGVEGAALGTITGQLVGLIILLTFYLRKKSILNITASDFIPDWKVTVKIIHIGLATFMSTVGTSIAMLFLNKSLSEHGGTAAITSMGAINSLFTLFIMPIIGIRQGMQPIIGYNYGAGLKQRVYETLKIGLIVGVIFSTFVFALLEIFPNVFVGMFLSPQSETFGVAVNGLRLFIIMLPLLCINFMGITFYQSTARGTLSIILGLLRQIVFLVPIVLVLPKYFGLTGVWLSAPIADALAIIITAVILIRDYSKDKSDIVQVVEA